MERSEYINKVVQELTILKRTFNNLNQLWNQESEHDMDLNEFISGLYPFQKSFDELNTDVEYWVDDAVKYLKLEK